MFQFTHPFKNLIKLQTRSIERKITMMRDHFLWVLRFRTSCEWRHHCLSLGLRFRVYLYRESHRRWRHCLLPEQKAGIFTVHYNKDNVLVSKLSMFTAHYKRARFLCSCFLSWHYRFHQTLFESPCGEWG